tara:strand:+ start:129 stop:665 length:537 start_codon:yes stop_codon:yes gene_type:complete
MNQQILLSILVVIAVILYTSPGALVKFGRSFIGKVVMLAIVVASASCGKLYGLVAVTLMIILLEFKYQEGYEGIKDKSDCDCEIKKDEPTEVEPSDKDEIEKATEAVEEAIKTASKAVNEAAAEVATEAATEVATDEGFLGNMISKVKNFSITGGDELIDVERNLCGKDSNQEFSKVN